MKSVLIVEDDFAIADGLKTLLEVKGYKVFLAADGALAIEAARKEMPDLMLLDVMLPRLGGFDVCRILKSEAKTKGIRIVVATGLGRMGDVETAFSAGADDYIIKPFDTDRLLKKIEKVLEK